MDVPLSGLPPQNQNFTKQIKNFIVSLSNLNLQKNYLQNLIKKKKLAQKHFDKHLICQQHLYRFRAQRILRRHQFSFLILLHKSL